MPILHNNSLKEAELEVSDLLESSLITRYKMGSEVPGLTLLSHLEKQFFPNK